MSIKRIVFCVVFVACFLFQYFSSTYLVAADLSEKQRSLANRYVQLEQALSRMSMATSKNDPKRAALLEKVLLLSKEKLIGSRLENIAALLEKRRLSDSATGQKEVEKDIAEMLQLLESDNQKDENALKREQLQRLIKELTELYNRQRINAQKAASQDKDNLDSVIDEQEKLRQLTEDIRKDLDKHEGQNSDNSEDSGENLSDKQSDSKQSENESDGQNGKNGKNAENNDQNQDSDKREGQNSNDSEKNPSNNKSENNSSDGQKGESGESAENNDARQNSDQHEGQNSSGDSSKKSSDNQSGNKQSGNKSGEQSGGDSESNESAENKDANEGNDSDNDSGSDAENSPQRDLKKANKHQRQAKKNLREKKKNEAHADMDAAAAEIIKAKEKLMKILRQLREEELMQTLEKLNARFKRMLQAEQAIRGQTEVLGNELKLLGVDSGEMRQVKIRAAKLSEDQGDVMNDADIALVLLREDGTAQAMLESLLQVRFDVEEIQSRLKQVEVDVVTIEIEDSVISTLQEMIDAVDEAIKESKERQEAMKQETPNQTPQNKEENEPLIKLLAELKMIKSMQIRLKERTERYEKLTAEKLQEDPQSDLSQISKSVEELTRQQNRISRILHNIKIGKTEKK